MGEIKGDCQLEGLGVTEWRIQKLFLGSHITKNHVYVYRGLHFNKRLQNPLNRA